MFTSQTNTKKCNDKKNVGLFIFLYLDIKSFKFMMVNNKFILVFYIVAEVIIFNHFLFIIFSLLINKTILQTDVHIKMNNLIQLKNFSVIIYNSKQ